MEKMNAGPDDFWDDWSNVPQYGSFYDADLMNNLSHLAAQNNSEIVFDNRQVGSQTYHSNESPVPSTYSHGGCPSGEGSFEADEVGRGTDPYPPYDTTNSVYGIQQNALAHNMQYGNTANVPLPRYDFPLQSSLETLPNLSYGHITGALNFDTNRSFDQSYHIQADSGAQNLIYPSGGDWENELLAPPVIFHSDSPYALLQNEKQFVAPPQELKTHSTDGVDAPSTSFTTNFDTSNSFARFGNQIMRTTSPDPLRTAEVTQTRRVAPVRRRKGQPLGHDGHQVGSLDSIASNMTLASSVRSGTSGSGISSRKQSGEAPHYRKRKRSDDEKGHMRSVRVNGGACEYCYLVRKRCKCKEPCHECQPLDSRRIYLWPAICYRRKFLEMIFQRPDLFGIEEREAFVLSQLRSMRGWEQLLRLGTGQRTHGDKITIDIDPNNILPVRIMVVDLEPIHMWLSNEDNTLSGHSKDTFREHSYAIIPEHLPSYSAMDNWVRRDIEFRAREQTNDDQQDPYDDLAAAIDIYLLQYSRQNSSNLYYDIVDTTMRIVNLGRFTDSRRPIDHNKAMELLEYLRSDRRPEHFGLQEFNAAKEIFSLSMTATQQLYIHAARGIIEAEKRLGPIIDAAFKGRRKNNTKDNIFIIGACLLRLILEYRQRLERYRSFPTFLDGLGERINGCIYMYTLYTRLYELWSRDDSIRVTTSSKQKVPRPLISIHDKGNLYGITKHVRRLELDFSRGMEYISDARSIDDDAFYRSQIAGRSTNAVRE